MKLRIDSIDELTAFLNLFKGFINGAEENIKSLHSALEIIEPFVETATTETEVELDVDAKTTGRNDSYQLGAGESEVESDVDAKTTGRNDSYQLGANETKVGVRSFQQETSPGLKDYPSSESIEPVNQPEEPEVDIDGVEWNPAVHSMGKTKTKEGRWRVKKGLQPVDDTKTDSFAAEVKKKYISKLEDGDMSLEEMMDIFDENGLLSIDDIEKQPQDILELLYEALS